MKKLLSLLSILTISGTAAPTTIAASPYQKEETIKNSDINYQQINRVKRGNENALRVKAKSLGHDWLFAKISHDTWYEIQFKHGNKTKEEFKNWLYTELNQFPKSNESWQTNVDWDEMSTGDVMIIVNVIANNFNNINGVFESKNSSNLGLMIRTNRVLYWENNDGWWGAHVNIWKDADSFSYWDRGVWE